MTTTVTPPSLSYFCIFNPTFCYDDDTLLDQIFFFTSRSDIVSSDEQLRKVGLIQGIISFASDFSNRKPVEIVDTRKTRTVIVEIEPNWWLALCVNFTRIQSPVSKSSSSSSGNNSNNTSNASTSSGSKSSPAKSTSSSKSNQNVIKSGVPGSEPSSVSSSKGRFSSFRRRKVELRTDYSRKEVPGCSVLHSQLIRGYSQWKLLYGRFPPSYVRDEAKETAAKARRRRMKEREDDLRKKMTDQEIEDAEESRDTFAQDVGSPGPSIPAIEVLTEQEREQMAREEAELDEMAWFRMDLQKFWSWWLHKWELYLSSTSTWGGLINNSFLANGLVLGSLPTLSFSFMDYANGIKIGGPGRISDLTSETIRAIVKREEKNGMVDLVITRMNSFSIVAPGGSLLRSTNPSALLNSSAADTISINGDRADAESLYSVKDADAISIMSSRSRRSRFFDKPPLASESIGAISEYGSDGEDSLTSQDALIDEERAIEEETRNGCIFQGVGYISRTSVAEYSRWIVDNHIFPSPTTIEGVKWSLYANKEDPMWPFSALMFSYKNGYKRPVPLKIKKKKNKRSSIAFTSEIAGSISNGKHGANGSSGKLGDLLLPKSKTEMSQSLLSKVLSGSTSTTSASGSALTEKIREVKDDLSDAKFLVGLQADLDMDAIFIDEDSDEEDGDRGKPELEITAREVYILRKRKKNRDRFGSVALQAQAQVRAANAAAAAAAAASAAETTSAGSPEENAEEEPEVTILSIDGTAAGDEIEGESTVNTSYDSIETITPEYALDGKRGLRSSTSPKPSSNKLEKLFVVVYKRAPLIFSAFYDAEKSQTALNNADYYKSLHLRLGTLVEPIFEDLENNI
ncbi:uncharacterized protein V1516DRAFT_672117 [Lipomyces oligophaga]|uniref:uncharacterized protein n=1 Tax=Lipomyces oligophaga TaxID=45792 RepID=UPI0034CFA8BD